jgi:hypothetical protein
MTPCGHLRQVRLRAVEETNAVDYMNDVRLSDVLPCAYPECPATSLGDGLVVPLADNLMTTYVREPNHYGWAWRRPK